MVLLALTYYGASYQCGTSILSENITKLLKKHTRKGICFFSSPPHQKIEKLITVIHVKPALNFGCILYKLSF